MCVRLLNNLISRRQKASPRLFPGMLLGQRISKGHLLVEQTHKPERHKKFADFCFSKEALQNLKTGTLETNEYEL